MIIIESRYEYWGPKGIKWTDWFPIISKYETRKEAEAEIKRLNEIKPVYNLRHEYRTRDI